MTDTKNIALDLTLGIVFGDKLVLEYLKLFKIHVHIFEVPKHSQYLRIIE